MVYNMSFLDYFLNVWYWIRVFNLFSQRYLISVTCEKFVSMVNWYLAWIVDKGPSNSIVIKYNILTTVYKILTISQEPNSYILKE